MQPAFFPLAGYPAWEGRDDDVQQPDEVLCISAHVQNSFDSHFGKWTLVHSGDGRKKRFKSKELVLPQSPAVARFSVVPFIAFLPVFLLSDATGSTQCGDTLNNEIKSSWSHTRPSQE